MLLIDSHCHLDGYARRGELAAVIERARAAGVGEMIAIGTDRDDWELNRQLARDHAGYVHYSVGLHPCNVGEDWESAAALIADYWRNDKDRPNALGECGLDRFHLPKDDAAAAARVFDWQRLAFVRQLEIAKELNCPLVVHSRHAFPECVQLIDASGVNWQKVVFHCFSEGADEMAELNRRGGRGSFTGILTYKNADSVRAAAKVQGLERFMVETDAPFLAPMPHRGKPNEPGLMRHTAEYAAGLFGISLEALAERATANTREFFGLAGGARCP
ncbi:MAG TPA: TatD family hydrolase [Opitutaceae bacterium]